MVLGVMAWLRLPIDAFPDVTNVQGQLRIEVDVAFDKSVPQLPVG